jgi:hypothetical protein
VGGAGGGMKRARLPGKQVSPASFIMSNPQSSCSAGKKTLGRAFTFASLGSARRTRRSPGMIG